MQTRLSANQSARTILAILYVFIQISFRAMHKEIYKKNVYRDTDRTEISFRD